MRGNISKSLNRVVGKATIRWSLRVDFDNGDKHTLTFHPLEKRWKVFLSNEKPSAATETTAEPQSTVTAKEPAAVAKNSNKPEKDGKSKAEKKARAGKSAGDKCTEAKAAKKMCSSKPEAGGNHNKQTAALSFGSALQSKIKEVSSRMHAASKPSEGEKSLVNYSPNSILARAAHAKSPIAPFSTQSIGYSSSLPSGTLSPDKKDGKRVPRDIEEKRTRDWPEQVSLISPPSPKPLSSCDNNLKQAALAPAACSSKGAKSQGSVECVKTIKASGNGGGQTVMQSLYRSECDKADDFVDYMTGLSKRNSDSAAASMSQDSKDDDDLELKLDNE